MPIAFKLDIRSALSIAYIPFLLVFFVNDFFSTLGTLLGCAGKAELLDEDGNLPDMKKPFLVDAVGTVAGTVMGTSTVIPMFSLLPVLRQGDVPALHP